MIKIDINKYKDYSFGEIASNISERVEPQATNLDIYVGLEHLDPECIHIKRKGVPADVKGTKLRVYPGDIIFGKRRAYQRKAGLVDFDGICSAHAMVVRANPEIILPELFPFFMHSDVLMHRAVDVSEGSLSPTIKWKILAEEKFKLPPLPEQKRLADLLWSVDKYVENKLCMNEKMILLLKSLIKKIFNLAKEKISLEEVLKEDCFNIEKTGKGKVPYIEIGDIDISEKRVILKNKPAVSGSKYAKQKDILISRVRPTRGAITIINFEKIAVSNAFTIIRSNEKVKQELLFFLLAYNDHLLSYLGRRSTGSTYPTINDSDIFSYKIPLMNEKNQKKLLSKCLALKQCSDLCNMDIKKIKEINQQLINQIFR